MRKALVVGIDYYTNVSPLYGCVNDSFAVKTMLDRHADGSVNFGVKHLTATGPTDPVGRDELRQAIESLLRGMVVSLLYFAGHGHIETTGGYLCSSDVKTETMVCHWPKSCSSAGIGLSVKVLLVPGTEEWLKSVMPIKSSSSKSSIGFKSHLLIKNSRHCSSSDF